MIFAIIMANNSNKKNFWHSLTKTFRLVIMTTDSFEEKFSTKVSFLKTVMFICSFLFVALLLSFLLLSYSPLNEYVPEKTNSRLQEQLISLSLKTDSLNTLIVSREAYLKNLTGIITDSPMKNNEKINSTEKKVLSEMLSNLGKTYSREQMSKITGISHQRSIDVMITRLRQKIEVSPSKPKYLQTIRGAGYVPWAE